MEEYKSRVPAIIAFEKDSEEKDLIIRELEEAVHKYIKTGVKSKQLDKVLDIEVKFQKGYQECFNAEQIIHVITSETKNEVLENVLSTFTLGEVQEKSVSGEIDTIIDVMQKKMEQLLNCELNKMLSEIAYLSHINMLYEMYEKESKLRQEEQEYKEIMDQYESMEEIVKQLRESRRMEVRKLQEAIKTPIQVVYATISKNPKYFNIKKRGDTYQISLSPTGRRISGHVIDSTVMYSQETLDHLVYKNCYGVIEGLEKTFSNKTGRILDGNISFEGVSPEKKRALQSKYHQLAQKVLEEDEEVYYVWNKLEGDDKYNEENKYKFKLSGYIVNN